MRNALLHSPIDSRVNISSRQNLLETVITICNRGTINQQELSSIRAPRIHGACPDKRSSGYGLGLFIADRIVSAHGGRLHIESSEHEVRVSAHVPHPSR
jgi:K+-sensing histidine kinase KdpD